VNLFSPFYPAATGIASYSEAYCAALQAQGVHVNCVNRSFWERSHLHSKAAMASRPARMINHACTLALSPFYRAPESCVKNFL